MIYRFAAVLTAISVLSGCAGTGKERVRLTEIELANRQWQLCSHFPTVELVDITAEGKLLVRDTSYSSPPIDFLRCTARVAYGQLQTGDRDAKTLIRDAYFTNAKPERSYLYKPSGHFPIKIVQFKSRQPVYFFFVVEVPSNAPARVSFEWTSPSGEKISVLRQHPKACVFVAR